MALTKEEIKFEREQDWRKKVRDSLKNKERTKLKRTPMPAEDPAERATSHIEVNRGYSLEQAMEEAKRCLDCPNPTCMTGCPVSINIPKFIKKIETGDILAAASVLKETSALPPSAAASARRKNNARPSASTPSR